MRRLCAWFRSLFRRPRRLLVILSFCAGVSVLAGPFVWAGGHWYAGQTALKRYHTTAAREHLNACLKIWPWSRSAWVHLLAARAARRLGDFAEAAQHLQQCQDTLGDYSAESVLEWAMLHAAAGDLDRVEEHLKTRARQDPEQSALIHEALIEGYVRMGRIIEALRSADEWLNQEPDNVQALYLRGNIHRHVGASQKSAADYRRAIELDPELHDVRRRLAPALIDIGRYEEAVYHLEFLRQIQPDDSELLAYLALCRYWLGKGQDARNLLDTILTKQPDHGLALRTRAQLAFLDGDFPEAEKWLRRAVYLMPYDYKVNWVLAECLQKQAKTEEAEAQRAQAEKLYNCLQRLSEIQTHLMTQDPDDPALLCQLGMLLIQLGELEAGAGWLRNAVRLDEHYAPALTALADYYQQHGDLAQAEAYRRRAGTLR